MANKRARPEEIVTKLRQVEVLTGPGVPRLVALRQIRATNQAYCRWGAGGRRKGVQSTVVPKNKFSGRGTDHLKELKRLQKENARLRNADSDLTLDKLILAVAAKDEWRSANHPVDGL